MKAIAQNTLRDFGKRHRQAGQPLKSWFKCVSTADWSSPDDVKADYRQASFLEGNRACFTIAENKYRLIVRINYSFRIAYIRFIGTHKEYDAIDANTV